MWTVQCKNIPSPPFLSSVTGLFWDVGKVTYPLCASVSPLHAVRRITPFTDFTEVLWKRISDCKVFWASWRAVVIEMQNIALSWLVSVRHCPLLKKNQNCSPVCHRPSTVNRDGRFSWSTGNWELCLWNRVKRSRWQSRSMETLMTTLCPWGYWYFLLSAIQCPVDLP